MEEKEGSIKVNIVDALVIIHVDALSNEVAHDSYNKILAVNWLVAMCRRSIYIYIYIYRIITTVSYGAHLLKMTPMSMMRWRR